MSAPPATTTACAVCVSGHSLVGQLKSALQACSHSVDAGDFSESERAIAATVSLLESAVESPPPDLEDALAEIHGFVSDPSNQLVVEALSYKLPIAIIKFVEQSERCQETIDQIIHTLISVCHPRDMLLVLCEVLDIHTKFSQRPIAHIIILTRMSEVLLLIQRHQVKEIKAAVPAILRVQDAVSSESDESDDLLCEFFSASLRISNSIQDICGRLTGMDKEELCAILGLYTLQGIALISRSMRGLNISKYHMLIKDNINVLPFCGLSLFGLLLEYDIDTLTGRISKGENDRFLDCFSLALNGASLPAIWCSISDEVANSIGEHRENVLNELRNDREKRWKALGTLKKILSMEYYRETKSYCIDFILGMMDESLVKRSDDRSSEFSSFVPSLFATLQAIQGIIMGASSTPLRIKAFSALRKIISDIPASERVDMIKALISNCNSSSMIAILIDLVKEEILLKNSHKDSQNNNVSMALWSSDVLTFVELVLKPPQGGPPLLPEYSEAVVSALNLYRFILIKESTGKTNHTGVMSECNLRKVHSEWLLPLRTLVSGVQQANRGDSSELADYVQCAINPVVCVLHHCIELVEDNLRHPWPLTA